MDEFIFNITAACPNSPQENVSPSQTTKSNPKGYKTTMNNTHLSSGSPKNHPSIHDIEIKNPGIFKTMDPQNKDHATSKSGQAPSQMPDQDRSVVSQQADSTCSPNNEPIYVSKLRCHHDSMGITIEHFQTLSPDEVQMYHSNKDDFLRDFAQGCAARGETLLEFGTPQALTIAEAMEQFRATEQAVVREMKKAAKKSKKGHSRNRPMSSYKSADEAIADKSRMVRAASDFAEKHFEIVGPLMVKGTPGEAHTIENARIAVKRCMENYPLFRAEVLEYTGRTERNRERHGEFLGVKCKYLDRPAPNEAICKAFNLHKAEYLLREMEICDSIAIRAMDALIFVQWPDEGNEGFVFSEREFLPWLREIESHVPPASGQVPYQMPDQDRNVVSHQPDNACSSKTHVSSGSPKNHTNIPNICEIKISNLDMVQTMSPQTEGCTAPTAGQAPHETQIHVVSQQADNTSSPASNEIIYVCNVRMRSDRTGAIADTAYVMSAEQIQNSKSEEDLRNRIMRDFADPNFTILNIGTPKISTATEVLEQQISNEWAMLRMMEEAAGKGEGQPMYQNVDEAIFASSPMIQAARKLALERFEFVENVAISGAPFGVPSMENARLAVKRHIERNSAFRAYVRELTSHTARNRDRFPQYSEVVSKYLFQYPPNEDVCTAFDISGLAYFMRELQIFDAIGTHALETFVDVQWPDEEFAISEKEFLPWLEEIEAAKDKT